MYLPHVWCESIGGSERAAPTNSCNLGDVETNGWTDATHGRSVEKATEEKNWIVRSEGEDCGRSDDDGGAEHQGGLAAVTVHEESTEKIPHHLHRRVQAD